MNEMNRKRRNTLLSVLYILTAVICIRASCVTASAESVHQRYYSARMTRTVKVKKKKIPAGASVTVIKNSSPKAVISYKKKKYKVLNSSYRLTNLVTRGDKPYRKAAAEAFVNKKKYKSSTKYLIWVSTYVQHVYVFKGRAKHWELIKHFKCATGRFGKETKMGICKVHGKMPWMWFDRSCGQGGYYGLRIRGGFIHSWLYNIGWANAHGGKKLLWSREHYGKPASSGCVRVNIKNAQWLYKNVSNKSTVVVY